jgi:hypothetical protein
LSRCYGGADVISIAGFRPTLKEPKAVLEARRLIAVEPDDDARNDPDARPADSSKPFPVVRAIVELLPHRGQILGVDGLDSDEQAAAAGGASELEELRIVRDLDGTLTDPPLAHGEHLTEEFAGVVRRAGDVVIDEDQISRDSSKFRDHVFDGTLAVVLLVEGADRGVRSMAPGQPGEA